MMDSKRWDVFISYSSADQPEVEGLARRLQTEAGLEVFFDKWRLVPGERFQPKLREAIRASRSCAVMLGKSGVGPWQNIEVEDAINKAVQDTANDGKDSFRVIPVLLPGAEGLSMSELPSFVDHATAVDFRLAKSITDDEQFRRLVAGIRGFSPGTPDAPHPWLRILTVAELEQPTGMTVDGRTILVADYGTGHLHRIKDGVVIKSQGGLYKPHHVLLTKSDSIIVADTHNHQVVHLDRDLTVIEKRKGFGKNKLCRPHGVASDSPGVYYIADSDHHRILRIAGNKISASAGKPDRDHGFGEGEFNIPCGITCNLDHVFVADTYNHRIQVLTKDLRSVGSFGRQGYGPGELAYPVGVAVWHQWIVIADEHNRRLQLWRRVGSELPISAECVSSDLCGHWLGKPFGVSFHDDQLWVADRKLARLVQINFRKMLAGLAALADNATAHA